MKLQAVFRAIAVGLSCLILALLFLPASLLSIQDTQWKSYEQYLFSFQENELSQWDASFKLIQKSYFPQATDLLTYSAQPETFYWINALHEGYIYTFATQETLPFGPFGEPPFRWKDPIDMTLSSSQLFVLDRALPSIECFDLQGKHLRSIPLPESLQPRYLSYRNEKLYLSDERSRSVLMMDLQGHKLHRFGRKGSSRGMMQTVGNFWIDTSSNVFIHDPVSQKLTCFPSFTHIPWHIPFHSQNFAISGNKIAHGLPGTPSFQVQDLPQLPIPEFQALPSLLDFGSIPIGKAVSRSLLILTSKAQSDHGTFSAEVPYIQFSDHQVHPHAHQVTVTITLPESYLDQNWSQVIKFHQDKKPALCIAVQAKGLKATFPAISVGGFAGKTSKDFYLPIQMEDLPRYYHYSLTGIPGKPVQVRPAPDADPPQLKVTSEGFLSPGYFLAQLTLIPYVKEHPNPQYSELIIPIPIYIRATEDYIPRETLMEGFDATWLIKSPITQEATLKLKKALYPYALTNICYYVASKEEAGLCCEDSEIRLKWYQSDQGIPTYYFNGSDYLKGIRGSTSKEAVEATFRAYYSAYLKDFNAYTPFAFDCLVNWSSASEGMLTIQVISEQANLTPGLGLNVALLKKQIFYEALSKDKNHYDVMQKFLTPVENQSFGIELNSENIQKPFSIPITLATPDSSLYDLIIFIQDKKSKEVLQSLRVDL
ncbi:MAG TPA: hypothetical protein PK581_00625 [Caldisericia bacterium]|nr:hypothetical protein [Caldisericia bacterium]